MQGSDLRALRKAVGLTQGEFGQALHLSGGYVGEMERGEKPVDPKVWSLAELLFGTRVTTGAFGDRFVVIKSSAIPKSLIPARRHVVQPQTYETEEEARIAARAIAGATLGCYYHP